MILFHHRRLFPPHTHPHMWRRGVPCIKHRFSLHTLCNLSFPPRCVTAGFYCICHIPQGFPRPAREVCCNHIILHFKLLLLCRGFSSVVAHIPDSSQERAVPDAGCGAESGLVSDIEI